MTPGFRSLSAQVPEAPRLDEILLNLAERADPELNRRRARAALDVLELELKARLAGLEKPEEKAAALARYFFEEKLFSSSNDLADPSNFYIDRVLDGKQGYCLSLSALIIAVGRRLSLPIKAVPTPRHVFVRWEEGGARIAIETTERGLLRDDAYYRQAAAISEKAEKEGVFLRSIDDRELVGHLLNNEGFIHWNAGRSELAERRFRSALELRPNLVEAMINIGIVLAERGEATEAGSWFDRAAQWLPGDAAVSYNKALARLHAGDALGALAVLGDPPPGAARDEWRIMLDRALLRPQSWKGLQAQVDEKGRELQKKGALRPGFRGRYWPAPRFVGSPRERIDRQIEFEWRWSAPISGIDGPSFSARWDAWAELDEAGVYSLIVAFEQGIRAWVDGICVIDLGQGRRDKLARENLKLEAGLHMLRIEYDAAHGPNGLIVSLKKADSGRALGPDRIRYEAKPSSR